jgi:peptide/nickel transport system permease protein
MSVVRAIVQRLLLFVPMLFGVLTVTFLIVHLIPGNPVYIIVGPAASEETIAALTHRLGLDKPLHLQYLDYLGGVVRGDLGVSLFTGAPVTSDLATRFPATLELITISLTLAILIAVPLGTINALRPGGIADRATFVYSFLAGATPDFWLALILVYVFYTKLSVAPPPLGRLGLLSPPTRITGMYLVDSILTGNTETLTAAAGHYVLPVATLVIVYAGPITKMMRQTMSSVLRSDAVRFARACGLPIGRVVIIAVKNSLPPVVTIVGITYGWLLGGAVLVESIFSWGGIGQYAVQSITHKDFVAIQGFVLVAASFSMLVYLLVDITYMIIDPRVRS